MIKKETGYSQYKRENGLTKESPGEVVLAYLESDQTFGVFHNEKVFKKLTNIKATDNYVQITSKLRQLMEKVITDSSFLREHALRSLDINDPDKVTPIRTVKAREDPIAAKIDQKMKDITIDIKGDIQKLLGWLGQK